MTNKEAIKFFKDRIELIDKCYPDIDDYREALVMAIQALDQEPSKTDILEKYRADVLDKVRAEIVQKANSGQWSEATIYGMKKSIAIIDKYKTESEG